MQQGAFPMSSPKTGVLFLNLGGPDCLESVKPFLFNLFADPDIIKLPLSEVFQKPLAAYISNTREHEAQENYKLMGGKSPILEFTQAQADLLKAELAQRGHAVENVYIAMRYWHPFTEAALQQMLKDGIERLIVLPLYPHFSYTSTGSSLNELKRVMEAKNIRFQSLSVVPPYYDHPRFLQAVAELMEQGLNENPWTCPKDEVQIVFSAHSLPVKHVKRTKDPYPDQIYECAKMLCSQYFPNNPWELAYQSKVGKMPWLGPSVDGILHYFAGKQRDNLLLVAISFVSDHVETLVELDAQYIPLANELGIEHCYRAPSLNTHPTFIQAMADLVITELEKTEPPTATFPTFPELLKTQAAS
jgi:ferrochelatase